MPLPTTNLTAHNDASDTDHIWLNWQAGTPFHNGTPSDGEEVQVWEDDDGKDLAWIYYTSSTATPRFRTTTPTMLLPNLDFEGDDVLKIQSEDGSSIKTGANMISANAHMFFAAIRVEACDTNAANDYDNDMIFGDLQGNWGLMIENASGTYSLQFYQFDGNVDHVELQISLNHDYVVAWWHTGGSIFAEVYDTTGLVASGNTASGDIGDLSGHVVIGKNYVTSWYEGRIGELAIYNAYNSSDKTSAVSYFRDKWVPGAGGSLTFSVFN